MLESHVLYWDDLFKHKNMIQSAVMMAINAVRLGAFISYNTVHYHISHTSLQWFRQNINQSVYSQQTPHSSPWQVSYGVSIVRICEEFDCIITATFGMWNEWSQGDKKSGASLTDRDVNTIMDK